MARQEQKTIIVVKSMSFYLPGLAGEMLQVPEHVPMQIVQKAGTSLD